MMPHLLAADLAGTENSDLRWMVGHACGHLLVRGDSRAVHDLAHDLHQRWRSRLGDDETLWAAAHFLASALGRMGRYNQARDLHQDILDRARRLRGENNANTLGYTAAVRD
jgi:hypothetical protein